MDDKLFQHPGQILREGRLGLFTQSPFLPVHFHWTTTRHIIQCCLVNSVRTIWGQFMRAGEQSCAFHFFRDRGFMCIPFFS
jgi:hypothetical protein